MNARDKKTVDRLRGGIAQLKREKFQLLQLIAAALSASHFSINICDLSLLTQR